MFFSAKGFAQIGTENWNGHKIRFVEKNGEWWAVGRDVAVALGYKNLSRDVNRHADVEDRQNYRNGTSEINNRGVTIINEIGIYALIFRSELHEARAFKRWIAGILKILREATGLDEADRSKFNLGRQGEALIINEFGIYAVFQSRKAEAIDFQGWVYKVPTTSSKAKIGHMR